MPDEIKAAARDAFLQFLRDPAYPSLHHHELQKTHRGQHRDGSRAVSVTRRYRALYFVDGETNVWYWVGTHGDYNLLTGRK